MEQDTKIRLIVAAGALTVAAAAAGIHQLNKHRLKKPLPGTTKIARLYIVKETNKK